VSPNLVHASTSALMSTRYFAVCGTPFLQVSISSICERLAQTTASVADKILTWVEPRAEERTKLLQHCTEIKTARSDLLKLLRAGNEAGDGLPPSLSALSLARTTCEGVGLSYAWQHHATKFNIIVRGHDGGLLNEPLPQGHNFEANVVRGVSDERLVTPVPVISNNDGTLTGVYRIPADIGLDSERNTEEMCLTVELHGSPVCGSPFRLLVSPEPKWTAALSFGSAGAGALQCPAGIAVHDTSLIRSRCLECFESGKAEMSLSMRPRPNERKQIIFQCPPNDLLASLLFLLATETDAGVLLQVCRGLTCRL